MREAVTRPARVLADALAALDGRAGYTPLLRQCLRLQAESLRRLRAQFQTECPRMEAENPQLLSLWLRTWEREEKRLKQALRGTDAAALSGLQHFCLTGCCLFQDMARLCPHIAAWAELFREQFAMVVTNSTTMSSRDS